jgi:hypothetical protein
MLNLNRRYRLIKIAAFVWVIFSSNGAVFAETARDMLSGFISINDAYDVRSGALLAGQVLQIVINGGTIKSETKTYTVFSRQGELTRINENSGYAYFLATPRGYWLYNKKLRSPLKVSGNYQISEIEIQDIFRIDYAEDYSALTFDDANETVLMERANRKMAYPYILISKPAIEGASAGIFEVCFMDRTKKPVRTLRFISGVVDGYTCFKTIEVYNAAFDKTESARYITQSMKAASVPAALFNESQMIQLASYIDNIIGGIIE